MREKKGGSKEMETLRIKPSETHISYVKNSQISEISYDSPNYLLGISQLQ